MWGPEEGGDVRKELSLDSDHSASGTGKGGLGKVKGVVLSRKSSLGLECGRDQMKRFKEKIGER